MALVQVQVTDGDTVRAPQGRIRVIGLNAPELRSSHVREDEPYAREALNHLQDLVANGVRLERDHEDRDKYGRLLRHLFDSTGRNISSEMLRSGLAFRASFAGTGKYDAEYVAAEAEARRQGLKLWSVNQVVSADTISRAGFSLARGHVQSIRRHPRGEVNLLVDSFLTIVVKEHVARGHDWDQYDGVAVEIRGWFTRRSRGRPWKLDLTSTTNIQLA